MEVMDPVYFYVGMLLLMKFEPVMFSHLVAFCAANLICFCTAFEFIQYFNSERFPD